MLRASVVQFCLRELEDVGPIVGGEQIGPALRAFDEVRDTDQ
jgi:hypothetical protein